MTRRLAWIGLAAILFSLPFIKEGDYSTLASVLAATVACLLAMASVGYSLTSFVSIVALTHLLFYPLAVWGNLLLPAPAVRWDLWVNSDLAMWGCTVGVLALGLGAIIAGGLTRPARPSSFGSKYHLSSFKFNVILSLLIVPVFFIELSLGLYFHSSITEYKLENNLYTNLLSLVKFIAYSGTFLQTFRYCRTRSSRDGYWALACCTLQILIFLPSGARGATFGFLPLLILAYLTWESGNYRKIMILLAGMSFILVFSYGIQMYRGVKNVEMLTFSQQFDSAVRSPFESDKSGGGILLAAKVVTERFSDYVAVGKIMAYTPDFIAYRGSEQLDKIWQIFVPGFLDILPERINLNDAIDTCDLYGVTKSSIFMTGTNPVMIIGDLFSRWGWGGVVLGMAVIGFILRQIDLRIFYRWDTFTVILFILFSRHIITIVSASVVNVMVMFLRELLAMALIAYSLTFFANLNPPKIYPKRETFNIQDTSRKK